MLLQMAKAHGSHAREPSVAAMVPSGQVWQVRLENVPAGQAMHSRLCIMSHAFTGTEPSGQVSVQGAHIMLLLRVHCCTM